MTFPKKGQAPAEVLASLQRSKEDDGDWKRGKIFSLVYHAGEEHTKLLHEAYGLFFMENGLNPMAFPSLRRFETEVVRAVTSLFHGPDTAAGSMTSGGTESVLMAVKTARDHARATRGIEAPEMIVPVSAHAAFDKAAHYFGVKIRHAPLDAGFRVDVAKVRELVNANTVLIVGSAPSYPQGVIDPIEELAALAVEQGILCHVDACLGGLLLPWAEKLGRKIRPFDFRMPGVTSLSADLHKYGFTAKGASTVIYRTRELRRHQFFAYADWPGGLFGSPSMAGTRPGGAIAAAWAAIHHLGEEGYLRIAKGILETSDALLAGVRAIPGLRVLGEPDMSVFAFTSDTLNIYEVGDGMDARGWKLDRQQRPPSLHLMVTPVHAPIVEPFLADLREVVGGLSAGGPAPDGSAAMYGMMGSLPDRGQVDQLLLDFLDGMDA